MRARVASTLGVFLVSTAAFANTYSVTTTTDGGPGSLRQAILDVNAHANADTITFNISGSGVQTLTLGSALPTITDAVTIDGYM